MAVRMQHTGSSVWFVTFTCYKWKPLLSHTQLYDAVYKWFDQLYAKGAAVIGYVIMPNHVHVLLHLPTQSAALNTVIGNAKRFLAYEIINRLKAGQDERLLQELYDSVSKREREKGQRYRVFKESFDAKACLTDAFLKQKLDYIHHNPVRGKWKLSADFAQYQHSSAPFYFGTGGGAYEKITRAEDVGRIFLQGSSGKRLM
jgi:REP element-mobilizing transposase RayT